MAKKATIDLEYAPYIDIAPVPPEVLFAEACKSDEITVNSWRSIWEKNTKENHERFGPFSSKAIGEIFECAQKRPVIIAGAGPSLKNNWEALKKRGDIHFVSCLHNFHFLEDRGVPADFYVTLDAGEIVIDEVYEGGQKSEEEYWAISEKRTLLAYIGTSPRLLEKWRGKVLFFNAPCPSPPVREKLESIEAFHQYASTGGNVLGACLYIARGFMGASTIAFMGADFSFSYDKKFHAWDSRYDESLGNVLRVRDVFGLPVFTWKSYHNFKGWFEHIAMTVPGQYYNCSEGGILGAYEMGNIRAIIQMPLEDFLRQMTFYTELSEQVHNPKTEIRKLLF